MKCGNGVINSPEAWDDKNNVSGDGCSSTCTIETGYEWDPDSSNNNVSKWTLKCGNGVINSPEAWDDKNNVSGDGCSSIALSKLDTNELQTFLNAVETALAPDWDDETGYECDKQQHF